MSNANTDPLWKALVEGDTACPDGEALAKLGKLLRSEAKAAPVAEDFSERVLDAVQEAGDEDALIDALYDDGEQAAVAAADPGLQRLRQVARSSAEPPQPVDLVPEVLGNLHRQSSRHALGDLDRVGRIRVWATVIAGHVAALITIVILQGQVFQAEEVIPENEYAAIPGKQEQAIINEVKREFDIEQLSAETRQAMATGLPLRWSQLRDRPDALFLLRQNEKLKAMYRRFYGTDSCQATVQAALKWLLLQQQDYNGAFHQQERARCGSRALATHSLAMLALLADGVHDTNRSAIERGVAHLREWIDDSGNIIIGETTVDRDVAQGMAALALVEAAIMLDDEALLKETEQVINHNLPLQRRPTAGLDGYFLLAAETAEVGGIAIAADDLAALRMRGRTGARDENAGHVGLMALTRYLYGYRDSGALRGQLNTLAALMPRLDEHQRSDPLSWFFPSLAFREAGGDAWERWNTALQRSLLPCFQYDNVANVAWVRHQQVRYADNDVFATSLVLLNLQAAHRYIPLSRSH